MSSMACTARASPDSPFHTAVSRGWSTRRSYIVTTSWDQPIVSSSTSNSSAEPESQPGTWSTQASGGSSRRMSPSKPERTSGEPRAKSDGWKASTERRFDMPTTIAASGAVHPRSGDHKSIADVEVVELEQVGVALVPGPGVEVGGQPGQPLVDEGRV